MYCYNSACQSWATHSPGTVMQENPVETTKQHYSGNFSTHFYCTHIKQSIMVRYQGCATEHSIRYVQLILRKTAVSGATAVISSTSRHVELPGSLMSLKHTLSSLTLKCAMQTRRAAGRGAMTPTSRPRQAQNGQPEAACKQSSNAFNKVLTRVLYCDRNACEPSRASLSYFADRLA